MQNPTITPFSDLVNAGFTAAEVMAYRRAEIREALDHFKRTLPFPEITESEARAALDKYRFVKANCRGHVNPMHAAIDRITRYRLAS